MNDHDGNTCDGDIITDIIGGLEHSRMIQSSLDRSTGRSHLLSRARAVYILYYTRLLLILPEDERERRLAVVGWWWKKREKRLIIHDGILWYIYMNDHDGNTCDGDIINDLIRGLEHSGIIRSSLDWSTVRSHHGSVIRTIHVWHVIILPVELLLSLLGVNQARNRRAEEFRVAGCAVIGQRGGAESR